MNTALILIPIFLPIVAGIIMEVFRTEKRKVLNICVAAVLVLEAIFVFANIKNIGAEITLIHLTSDLPVFFKIDTLGIVFAVLMSIVWLAAGVFSFEYMKHEGNESRYQGFYIIVLGVLVALDFAGNLLTFYMFYELMTLTALMLILHSGKRDAIMAGLKYLFYSLCGAYLVLFGFYFVYKYAETITFSFGGTIINPRGHEQLLLICALFMIMGFGVKSGMLPLHGWLTSAHPVAPAPASAVLSGVIVKAGVLGIIRTVYYIFGTEFIRGSFVQTVWMALSLATVFMGSTLAMREKLLKKRLAYSTVSQASYILFGLSLMNTSGMEGSLLHVLMHAVTKCGLFLAAGAIIYSTGRTRVDELRGIGKEMPITIWCFTLLSVTLIGIPPTGGFISKWYLCKGALESGIPGFQYVGPVVLLISALLTAGYLLPISVNGFLPGEDFDYAGLTKKDPNALMTVPLIVLTVLAFAVGIFSDRLLMIIDKIAGLV